MVAKKLFIPVMILVDYNNYNKTKKLPPPQNQQSGATVPRRVPPLNIALWYYVHRYSQTKFIVL